MLISWFEALFSTNKIALKDTTHAFVRKKTRVDMFHRKGPIPWPELKPSKYFKD